jgi:YfiH family protein
VRADVIENRARVSTALGAELVTLGQVHSADVVRIAKGWPIGERAEDDPSSIPRGDAMVTKTQGIALGILTADCAPVLFADSEAKVIGGAHAGWKGALSGVLEATLAAMEGLGAERGRIRAAIGPCISQPNYEVGPEFRARFVEAGAGNAQFFIASGRTGHFRFDLDAFVAARLAAAGLAEVERLRACTYAREAEFFSFRRATHRGETGYGRQVSAIALTESEN